MKFPGIQNISKRSTVINRFSFWEMQKLEKLKELLRTKVNKKELKTFPIKLLGAKSIVCFLPLPQISLTSAEITAVAWIFFPGIVETF